MSANKLYNNKELFKKQENCFYWLNILYGSIVIPTVWLGAEMVLLTQEAKEDHAKHILCVHNRWAPQDLYGYVFVFAH